MIKTGKFELADFSDYTARALQRMRDQMIDSAIGNFGFGRGNEGSGILGSLADVGGSLFDFGFDGFFADGGPVRGNHPIMVGERGPELFVPNSAGNIMPNHQLGGAGGYPLATQEKQAPPINVNIHQNFAVGVAQTVRVEMKNMMPHWEKRMLAVMAHEVGRGGAFARAIRGNY